MATRLHRSASRPVAILGGAFDPVTNAHLDVARRVATAGFRVVFLPCGDSHAFGKRMLPARDRLALLQLATTGRFDISTFEIESGSSRTSSSWPALARLYGRVHWIIGSDHASAFDRWQDGPQLQRELPFIVVERPGHILCDSGRWCLQPPHRFLPLNRSTATVSSTEVRAAIRAGHWAAVARLIPAPVRTAIRAHGWYAHREPLP